MSRLTLYPQQRRTLQPYSGLNGYRAIDPITIAVSLCAGGIESVSLAVFSAYLLPILVLNPGAMAMAKRV
jgi:hypothetical protein